MSEPGAPDGHPDMEGMVITSGFGHNTQQPFVGMHAGAKDFHIQMRPQDAIAIAHHLIRQAEAALTDAFIITFMRKRVGLDDAVTVGLLEEFREFREQAAAGKEPWK